MEVNLDKLGELVSHKHKPTNMEAIYFLFWEKGISLEEFNKLPLPYIFGILKVSNYKNKEEEKAYKKANRKK